MRPHLFTLTASQRDAMWRRFKQTNDHRVAERLHAILLLDAGQNRAAICQILHVHTNTLKRWVQAFAAGGEDALLRTNYGHPNGWLTAEEQQEFTTWLDTDVRTTAEACAWVLEQFGTEDTDSGMRKLLKRLDDRFKQPTLIPAKADPAAQAAWVATYAEKRGP